MIKKIRTIMILLIVAIGLIPFTVKADMTPVAIDGYSNEATIGSQLVFVIRGYKDFDGTIEYNKNELEYLSISEVPAAYIEGGAETGVSTITSNTPGVLKFTHKEIGTGIIDILVTFKVKDVSDSGKTTITYTPKNSAVLYSQKNISKDFTIIKQKENSTQSPVVQENDDTPLYVSWGISGILMIALIALAIKKK